MTDTTLPLPEDPDATPSAVVVLSGGQDSLTAYALFLKLHPRVRHEDIVAVTFDYGQRHVAEVEAAKEIAQIVGLEHHVLELRGLFGGSLTDPDVSPYAQKTAYGTRVPSTFAPGRNLVMLTAAASFARRRFPGHKGTLFVVTGVCQTDYSGYPDCRESTMLAVQTALRLGMEHPVEVVTPLMWKTKAEEVRDLAALDGLNHGDDAWTASGVSGSYPLWRALSRTISCYNGQHGGCGACDACRLREAGFRDAGFSDPAKRLYRNLSR